MIIQDLKKHFPPRAIEWLLSGVLFSWGMGVIVQPGLFAENPSFSNMANIAAQPVWGLAAFIVGGSRAVALFINGVWQRTPAIRVLTSFFSAFIWTQILLGVAGSHHANLGIFVWPWFIAADWYSAFSASADVRAAAINRKVQLSSGPEDDTTRTTI